MGENSYVVRCGGSYEAAASGRTPIDRAPPAEVSLGSVPGFIVRAARGGGVDSAVIERSEQAPTFFSELRMPRSSGHALIAAGGRGLITHASAGSTSSRLYRGTFPKESVAFRMFTNASSR
jgi:hypothetical protein